MSPYFPDKRALNMQKLELCLPSGAAAVDHAGPNCALPWVAMHESTDLLDTKAGEDAIAALVSLILTGIAAISQILE